MIKVKLQERRTISVSDDLVDGISNFYKLNYLKLVEIFLVHNNKKESKNKKGTNLYKIALDRFKEQYSDLLVGKSPISAADFKSNLDSDLSQKIIYEIASLPSEKIIPHILKQETAVNAFKSAGMGQKRATKAMQAYLDSTGFKDIKMLLELSRKEDKYHGIMDYESMSISVNYNVEPFEGLVFQSNVEELFKTIDKELSLTKRTVYHEFQHLFVNIVRQATGLSSYGAAPRATSLGATPNDNPNEIQTYAQNSVTLFNDMINILNIEPEQLPFAKKVLLKKLVGSQLSAEEKQLYKELEQQNIKTYMNNIKDNLETIKTYNPKFYNYALSILYTSVNDQLQENIIMNKIKVILKESTILTEELTKEEIRKLVRDEFEKMLKDKDAKKEIAKITKEFVKKFYRELSFSSTHVIDQIDV
jgi:hypothetical protein